MDLLKDGNGDYLYRPSVTVDAPPTLLGRPIYISERMPAIGAGTYPSAFGNFTAGYVIAEKPGVRFLRDPFSSKPNVLFYAYRRVGGAVVDTDAIKLLKISAKQGTALAYGLCELARKAARCSTDALPILPKESLTKPRG